jgi:DNA (cytosine-5)-methyltransferase 1
VPVDFCARTGAWDKGRPVLVVSGPSPTVTIEAGRADPSISTGVPFIDGPERRRLTVAEAARLQDFPARHPWQGPEGKHYSQIGNAVPPKLAEVVGRAVMQAEATR